VVTSGSTITLADGESVTVIGGPDRGELLRHNVDDEWTFTHGTRDR
jgi:hypothetical protein